MNHVATDPGACNQSNVTIGYSELMPLNAEAIRGTDAFVSLAGAWDDLFRRASDSGVYVSRHWSNAWLTSGRLAGEPVALTVWSGTTLVALLPLEVSRRIGFRVASPLGTGQPAYLGVLRDPAYPGWAAEMAQLCVRAQVFDALVTHDLSSIDRATNDLLVELRSRGFLHRQAFRNPCHYVRLGCTLEQYLQTKSARSRRKLRSKERNLAQAGAKVEYYAGSAITSEILDRINAVQEQSWMKRRGAAVLGRPFFRTLLTDLARAELGRVWLMTIDGEDAAFIFGLVAHRRFEFAWTSFKLKFLPLSVGNALTYSAIGRACSDGVELFDFGHGDAEYKRFWATDTHNVTRYVIGRGPRGRAVAVTYGLTWRAAKRPWVRSAYRRVKVLLGR